MMTSENDRQLLLHSITPAMQTALNVYTWRSAESGQALQDPAKNTDEKTDGKPLSGSATRQGAPRPSARGETLSGNQ